ncbi:MAG TPA: hypothetical protein VFK94_02420, partial [Patescibacteria group bacterium]|nr:hypothetical protein [Patescibacteria group bacterium]
MLEHKRREMEEKKRKFLNQQSGSNNRPRYNSQPMNQQRSQGQGQSSLINRSQNQQRPQYPQPQQQQQQLRLLNTQQTGQAPRLS